MIRINQILSAIKDYGPMTGAEIAEITGISARQIYTTLAELSRPCSIFPQRVHVKSWISDHHGQRRYPRPVYAIGPGINIKKPKADQNARKREYEARKKSILKTSSVFNLAVPLKCLRFRSTPGTKTANSASDVSTT